ncbi:MAG TPA: hypothetical protein VFL76_06450 [Edaphocola sp.]|nr:hypothetical protein [Edaphocola sp.]
MRKQILKSLILGAAMLGATALTASAAVNHVFIVSNNTTYSLTTKVAAGESGTAFEWLTYGGTQLQLGTDSTYSPTTTAPGTAAIADTFLTRYQTGGATGCWSNYDTVLVYTLPSIEVTVTAQNATVCSNDNADTLTATTNFASLDFSVMGSVSGIDYTSFAWSPMTGAAAFNTKNHQLATTQSGNYTATTIYDATTLPATVNSLPVTATKVDGAYSNATAVTVTVTTAPDQPTVTIQ